MSELRALIFDCDGVLAETERDGHRVTFNAAFEAAGLPTRWDDATYGELVRISGGKERMRHYFTQHPEELPQGADLDECIVALHQAISCPRKSRRPTSTCSHSSVCRSGRRSAL